MAPTKQSTRHCFTLNNYTDHDIELLRKFYADYCKYLVYGKEVGESGTPHLQGFFTLKLKLSMVGVHKALGTSAIALLAAKGSSAQASTYCKKGEQSHEEWESLKDSGPNYGLNYKGEEFGQVPFVGKRCDLDILCEAVQNGQSMLEVSKLHPASYVRNYRGLASLQALNTDSYEHHTVRGIYIWGPPGTGKSHTARNMCPESLYIKAQNKWWDGYSGESHVLLDDMDGNFLGHYLKIWADKYACTGEIKGGVVKLCHTTFIVTSNYSIEAMWKDDPVMAAAIKRRFKVIHMTTPYMFKPTSQIASLVSKVNHIFGTTPLTHPRPIRKTNTGLPVVEEWRKKKTKDVFTPPVSDDDSSKKTPRFATIATL